MSDTQLYSQFSVVFLDVRVVPFEAITTFAG